LLCNANSDTLETVLRIGMGLVTNSGAVAFITKINNRSLLP